LTGFGQLKEAEDETTQTYTIETLRWAAPEELGNRMWSGRADIYSLGMVFFEIISCETPFKGQFFCV
jgi:serine/threonine protein kinase